MSVDLDLVEKGARIPLIGLVDQGLAHIELCQQHDDALRSHGWSEDLMAEFIRAVDRVRDERAAVIEARTESKDNRAREQAAVTEAKAFKRKLVHAFTDLRADKAVSDHVHKGVIRSGRLGRSPALFSGYFTDIKPHVEALDGELRRYFQGESPATMLREIVHELDTSQAIQETNYQALPLETQKLYEAKGHLLMMIEKINRIGKIAFDGNAKMIALFNKDLINRARQKRRTTSGLEAVEPAVSAEGEEAG